MNIVTYISSLEDIVELKKNGVKEAILCTSTFSRLGKTKLSDVNELARACQEEGIKAVFEWDILMVETVFSALVPKLSEIDFSLFGAIRVQDPGAIEYILSNYPDLKIQLNLETGNHNLAGIKRWVDYVGDRLDRVILSIEFSKDKLSEYIEKLDCEVEYLALGRILLFYTPRNLLAPFIFDHEDSEVVSVHERPIEVKGSSEESPHSGFPIIENQHGTFMFNIKDHCVLENLNELVDMNLSWMRIDLRFEGMSLSLLESINALTKDFSKEKANSVKEFYPAKVIRGYYSVNKSDALFKKLKNRRILRNDENYLGDVYEVNKKKHIGVLIRNSKRSLKVGQIVEVKTPDGRSKSLKVSFLKNSSHQDLEIAKNGQVVFIPHVSGVSFKSTVYLKESE